MNNWTNDINFNCRIFLEDGQEFLIFGNRLHNLELDYWKGWTCMAGTKRLHIDKNFDVYSAKCFNDFIGNAITGFDIFENGTICTREHCTGCIEDLIIEKYKHT